MSFLERAAQEDMGPPPPGWDFTASTYLWLARRSGVVQTDDLGNLGIVLDDTDKAAGAFLYFEGQRDRWGFLADLDLLSTEDTTSTSTGSIKVEEDVVIGELDGTYSPPGASTLQFLLGVRVLNSSQDIFLPTLGKQTVNTTLIDPVVGAQGSWPLGEKFGFRVRGDVGGFGADSDFTYQGLGVFSWSFAPHWTATAGYRLVGWEFEKEGVRNDLRLQGVLVGLAAHF